MFGMKPRGQIARAAFRIVVILLLPIAFSLAAGCGGGGGAPAPSQPQGTGVVSGKIYSKVLNRTAEASSALRIPVVSADISCAGLTASTNADGYFRLENVPAGRQECSVSKKGYKTIGFVVDLTAGGTADMPEIEGLSPEQTGTLIVTAEPGGASIVLDGLAIDGFDNGAALGEVAAGQHEISAILEGYEPAATQSISIQKNATTTVSFTLVKLTISLEISGAAETAEVGAEKQLAAMCLLAGGGNGECTKQVAWQSSDPAVASVTEEGLFKALSPGSAVISITRAQSRITFPGVTVNVVCPDGKSWTGQVCSGDELRAITLTPGDARIDTGGVMQAASVCVWERAGEAPCPALDWKTSSAGIAMVSDLGSITGVKAGTAGITASLGNVRSNAISVKVISSAVPDASCVEGAGFCVDIAGGEAPAGGAGDVSLVMKNPPPAGIGAGVITIVWDEDRLEFSSSEPGAGVVIRAENSSTPGRYRIVFSATKPLTQGQALASLRFKAKVGASLPAELKFDRSARGTNFADFAYNTLSQQAVVFMDGYITELARL